MKGHRLHQYRADSAEAAALPRDVSKPTPAFFYVCPNFSICKFHVGVAAEPQPLNRHQLYKHLKLLFHPGMVYAKSLHLHARLGLVVMVVVAVALQRRQKWPLHLHARWGWGGWRWRAEQRWPCEKSAHSEKVQVFSMSSH